MPDIAVTPKSGTTPYTPWLADPRAQASLSLTLGILELKCSMDQTD